MLRECKNNALTVITYALTQSFTWQPNCLNLFDKSKVSWAAWQTPLLWTFKDIAGTKDNLVKKLKDHLRDQKHAIESAVEDKLNAVENKENELQQLRHALRDRDRLIEKINSAVVEGDEKIKVQLNPERGKGGNQLLNF